MTHQPTGLGGPDRRRRTRQAAALLRYTLALRILIHPFPPGWVAAAVAWTAAGTMLLLELAKVGNGVELLEGWRMITLLWGEVGAAGVIIAALHHQPGRIPWLLILTILPPLLLYGFAEYLDVNR